MVIVGYARVSTEGQILDLRKFGCTEIFRENASGADREHPQLMAVLGRVRKGDTLVVVRIDRLVRSARASAGSSSAKACARTPAPRPGRTGQHQGLARPGARAGLDRA